MITLEQFERGIKRLAIGSAILVGAFIAVLLVGALVSLCFNYPWVNLVWAIPLLLTLAWGLGGNVR